MKVMARQCPWTQKLFLDDSEYLVHLTKLREKQRITRYHTAQCEKGNQAIEWATQNVTSPREFEDWMQENWEALVIRGTYISPWDKSHLKRMDQLVIPKLKSVKLDVTFYPLVSNSHSCPRGGVKNFTQKSDLPRGYPGWKGYLAWRHEYPVKTRVDTSNDMFDYSPICSGGGSGGGGYFGYDVILWASDWPAWTLRYEQEQMWAILQNR